MEAVSTYIFVNKRRCFADVWYNFVMSTRGTYRQCGEYELTVQTDPRVNLSSKRLNVCAKLVDLALRTAFGSADLTSPTTVSFTPDYERKKGSPKEMAIGSSYRETISPDGQKTNIVDILVPEISMEVLQQTTTVRQLECFEALAASAMLNVINLEANARSASSDTDWDVFSHVGKDLEALTISKHVLAQNQKLIR